MLQQLPLPLKNISSGTTLDTNTVKIGLCSLLLLTITVLSDSLHLHPADSLNHDLQDEPICLWQKSAAQNNLPEWLLPDQDGERGMAYYNQKLYIVSRSKGTSVRIVNAANGNDEGALLLDATIKGGTYLLNDIESDSSGNLLACNLAATPKSRNFKIYRWKNSSAKPELFLSYPNPQKYRLGDHFSLSGNLETRADIFAAAAGTDKVLHWQIIKGKISKDPQIITLINLSSCGTAPYIEPLSGGGYILNANSLTPKQFDKNGRLTGSISETVIPTGSTVFKQVITDHDTLLLFYLSTPAAKGGQNIRAIKKNGSTLEKISPADILFTTPSLGTNSNSNFVGDIESYRQGRDLTFFVLATNNGLAAYRYTLPFRAQANIVQPAKIEIEENRQPEIPYPEIVLPIIIATEPEIDPAIMLPEPMPVSFIKSLSITETGAEIPAPPAYLPVQTSTQISIISQIPANAGMMPIKKEESRSVYFNADRPQTAGFLVFNIKGELVYSFQQQIMPGRNSFNLPIKGWKNGIYPYKIILEDRIISGKTLHIK